jgi:hypothetical protein
MHAHVRNLAAKVAFMALLASAEFEARQTQSPCVWSPDSHFDLPFTLDHSIVNEILKAEICVHFGPALG